MAIVVFLRGVNVGGHRTLRPAALARELAHLGAVNVGAAGTLVIRHRVTRAGLRAELERRVPFETELVMCKGEELARLVARDPFAGHPARRDVVHFVSVLARRPRSPPSLPLRLPSRGRWMVQVLAREDRLLVGVYRREMKVIGYLGKLDEVFGAPATTRSWSTLTAVLRVLDGPRRARPRS